MSHTSDIPERDGYKWYVLGMLTLVLTFNFIDRQILVILQEPIKAELGLSDTQLGMLTGLAFAAFYVTLGIPIARWADLGNRKRIIAICLGLWSAMTAVSGAVVNFVQLLLARIGVGVGEAGCSPPAHSLISDYFPPEKRATALSIYSTGIYFGILLGYVIGGVIAKFYGWRIAFWTLGIPGVLFAFLVYFSIREPVKGRLDVKSIDDSTPSLKEVIKILLSKKTFLYVAFGSGINTFATYGVGNFLPSFLQRVHEVDIATAGLVLGLSTGIGGMIGTYLGGFFADKLRDRDRRWYMWVPLVAGLFNIIPSLLLFFSDHTQLVMVMTFFTAAFTAFYLGPSIAVCHSLVSAKMRALTSAVFFLILNFIGLGLGPLTIGFLSDLLKNVYGSQSLRWAFSITIFTGLISAMLFLMGARSYRQELKEAELSI